MCPGGAGEHSHPAPDKGVGAGQVIGLGPKISLGTHHHALGDSCSCTPSVGRVHPGRGAVAGALPGSKTCSTPDSEEAPAAPP